MITTKTTDAAGNVIKAPLFWSFSRLRNFETCARQFNELEVLKNYPKTESDELRYGNAVHKALAKRIADDKPLPANMPYESWAEYALNLDGTVYAERQMAITEGFKPCEYWDKVKPVWLRTGADVLALNDDKAHIIDWKTNKKIDPQLDQLMLIATCVMVHYPQVFNILAELVWLGFNTKTVMVCTVDDIVEFWNEGTIRDRVFELQDALETGNFPPKPSGLCKRHCPVTTCEHCGRE